MRKVLVGIIPCLTFFALSGSLRAQDNELSIKRVMDDAANHIARIERNNYKISKLEIDLIFKGTPRETLLKLVAGRRYEIFTAGERNRIADMDLRVYDANKTLLKDFPNTSNQIETDFTPPETGFYTFEFLASDFFPSYTGGRYLLIIAFR